VSNHFCIVLRYNVNVWLQQDTVFNAGSAVGSTSHVLASTTASTSGSAIPIAVLLLLLVLKSITPSPTIIIPVQLSLLYSVHASIVLTSTARPSSTTTKQAQLHIKAIKT
jgi:hypothetical protein